MNKLIKIIWLLLLVITANNNPCFSQRSDEDGDNSYPALYTAFGLGFDFGGIGAKIELFPIKYAGIFAGGGHNFDNIAYNVGVKVIPFTTKNMGVYLTGMYGYNSVVIVIKAPSYNKTGYGFSFGVGSEIYLKEGKSLQVGSLIPIRSLPFKNHIESLKKNPNISLTAPVLPFVLTIGLKIRV